MLSFVVEFSWILLIIMIIAFICEFMDSSLGMGYGTTLTPILLLFGFNTALIVPAVLLSEFVTGAVAAIFHAIFKNFHLGKKTNHYSQAVINQEVVFDKHNDSGGEEMLFEGEKPVIKEKNTTHKIFDFFTRDTNVVIVLALFGIFGVLTSSILSVIFDYNAVFRFGVKIYIGVMVFFMGIIMIIFRKSKMIFTYKKIISLGVLAGFNKGISGGGFGPITVSGQILSGMEGKNAIASTTLAESIVCFVGIIAYIVTHIVEMYFSGEAITWEYLGLAPYLMIGSVLSAPFAAFTTKKIKADYLKIIIGVVTSLLGMFLLLRSGLQFAEIWV